MQRTLAAALALASLAAAPEGGVLLDRVVAVVAGQVVTQSDLWLEARVATKVANLDDPRPDAPTMKSALAWVVGRLLLSAEAERLQVFKVSESEVQAELARFRERFSDGAYPRFLGEMDVREDDVADILRRDLRVQRYLDSRVKIAAQVRDAEVDAFYREKKREFGNQPLSDIREVVRAYLYRVKYERLVAELVADLKRRGDVEILVDFH